MTIRPATLADAEALARLHLDVWDDAYTGLMPQRVLDERRTNLDARVERWRTTLTDSAETTWLAVADDGTLVGFGGSGPARADDVGLERELYALYVRASAYGTGVGYALFRAALGDGAAYLWVLAGNERAIGFYERQGFRLDGAVDDEDDHGRYLRMVRAARHTGP